MNKVVYSPYTLSLLLLIVSLLASCHQVSPLNQQHDIEKDPISTTQQIGLQMQEAASNEEKLISFITKASPNGKVIAQELAGNKSFFNFIPHCDTFTALDMAVLVTHPRFPLITQICLRNKQLDATSLTILTGYYHPRRTSVSAFFKNFTKPQKTFLPEEVAGDNAQKNVMPNINNLENLISLDLGLNPIGTTGIGILISSINYANLKFLYLEDTQISDVDIKTLAPYLAQSQKLEFLVLNKNKIGNKGLLDLILHLPKLIRRLELNHNHIGDRGMKGFARYLPSAKNVSVIKFKNNKIGDLGIQELILNFQKSTELASFDLSDNKISESAKKNLRDKIEAVDMDPSILYLN